MNGGSGTKKLVRSRQGRMVAGICAGAADYFGVDVTLVRVIVAVVAVITGGAGVLAYLVAWVIIPEEDEKTLVSENGVGKKQDASAGR
jgi:phage shock protein PspC (stress-responsive transcriptional regulator)